MAVIVSIALNSFKLEGFELVSVTLFERNSLMVCTDALLEIVNPCLINYIFVVFME